jgi:uncharacterized protein YkwD
LALVWGAAGRRDPFAELRRGIHAALDRERAVRGVAGLALDEALCRWADERAAQAESAGGVAGAGLSSERALSALRQRGYEAERIAEVLVQSDGSPQEVLDFFRGRAGEGFDEALSHDYHDLGVGVAVPDAAPPIYALVLARSTAAAFRARTEPLADLEAVRAALLEAANSARREARRRPLAADQRLDLAAQAYAELMMGRGHYGHTGPEGSTPRDRAVAAGYDPRAVAENLARGPDSAAAVVAAWLESPRHRRNLLDRDLVDVGHGLAFGRGPDGWHIYWVQLLGASD